MPRKLPSIPGFATVSEQVLLREPDAANGTVAPADDPELVLIYGWGDGQAKHVAKYADGFRALYPHARQLVILGSIYKALFTDLAGRTAPMMAVVETAFPKDDGAGAGAEPSPPPKVLAHCMSNTGAINYASTLYAYRQARGRQLPHRLTVLDSTPGGTDYTVANVKRWARAMALAVAAWFPWPFAVTQGILAACLFLLGFVERVTGRDSAGAWGWKVANDEGLELRSARRLYLYSAEDEIIDSKDVERHAAEARQLGWEADTELFHGSNHVGHMRKAPEQYWNAIKASWELATKTAGLS